MRHEKIIKRDDGSRIRINVSFRAEWSGMMWDFSVDTCKAGKRSWYPATDGDSYAFRKLSMSQRTQAIRDAALLLASESEVLETMLELWQKLKPIIDKSGSIE